MAFENSDVVIDSPVNNFAVWNLLHSKSFVTLTEGNLKAQVPSGNIHSHTISTIIMTSGHKWYFEVHAANASSDSCAVGIVGKTRQLGPDYSNNSQNRQLVQNMGYPKVGVEVRGYVCHDITTNGDWGSALAGNSGGVNSTIDGCYTGGLDWSNSQSSNPHTPVIGVLVDLIGDGQYGTISWTLDGVNYPNPYTKVPLDIGWAAAVSGYNQDIWIANFGQNPTFNGLKTDGGGYTDASDRGVFYHQPPADTISLCTANLPEGPIKLSQDQTPSDHFKAVKYTGNNTDGHQINDVGFKSDLIWIKTRDVASQHVLIDSVRGHDRELFSSKTDAEQNSTTPNHVPALEAITDDGFTLKQNVYPTGSTNGATRHIAWCWKAAGSPADGGSSAAGSARIIEEDGTQADTTCAALASAATSAGSSNVIMPSKVSANRQNGFSLVKFNGVNSAATLPHGLSNEPEMVIFKKTSAASNWIVHRNGDPATKFLYLNAPNELSNAGADMVTGYSNSVLSLGTDGDVNPSDGASMIMYCWHSVAGYSKIGSYIGNGSADGPYVDCGFRPSFVMAKNINASEVWQIWDNQREGSNGNNYRLFPNAPSTEATDTNPNEIDLLSNGFKLRHTNSANNGNNQRMIFAAFAEQPLSGPSNAR